MYYFVPLLLTHVHKCHGSTQCSQCNISDNWDIYYRRIRRWFSGSEATHTKHSSHRDRLSWSKTFEVFYYFQNLIFAPMFRYTSDYVLERGPLEAFIYHEFWTSLLLLHHLRCKNKSGSGMRGNKDVGMNHICIWLTIVEAQSVGRCQRWNTCLIEERSDVSWGPTKRFYRFSSQMVRQPQQTSLKWSPKVQEAWTVRW